MRTELNRIKSILLNPRDEWLAIKDKPPAYRDVFRYAALLASIPPLASMANGILLNGNMQDRPLAFSFSSLMMTNMIWYGMCVLNIVIAGMIIAMILVMADSRWSGLRGLTIAAYSFTPLYLAVFIAAVTSLEWTYYPAALYAIYLLYCGITLLVKIPKMKAAWFTLSSFLVAAVILSIMNLFEYLFESFLTGKVFS